MWKFSSFFYDSANNTAENLRKHEFRKWQLEDGVALVGCWNQPFLMGSLGVEVVPRSMLHRHVGDYVVFMAGGTPASMFSLCARAVLELPTFHGELSAPGIDFHSGIDLMEACKTLGCILFTHVEYDLAVVLGMDLEPRAIGMVDSDGQFLYRNNLEKIHDSAASRLLKSFLGKNGKRVPLPLASLENALLDTAQIDIILAAYKKNQRAENKKKKNAAKEKYLHDEVVARLSRRSAAAAVKAVLHATGAEDARRERADRLVASAARRTASAAIDGVLAAARREDASRAERLAAVRKLNADKAGAVARARLERQKPVAKPVRDKHRAPAVHPKPVTNPRRCKDGLDCKFLGVRCAFWHPAHEIQAAPTVVCPFHPYCRQRSVCRCLHPKAPVAAPVKPVEQVKVKAPVAAPVKPVEASEPPVKPVKAPVEAVKAPAKATDFECPICFEEVEDRHAIQCGHVCCERCARLQVREGACFVCSASVAMSLRIYV